MSEKFSEICPFSKRPCGERRWTIQKIGQAGTAASEYKDFFDSLPWHEKVIVVAKGESPSAVERGFNDYADSLKRVMGNPPARKCDESMCGMHASGVQEIARLRLPGSVEIDFVDQAQEAPSSQEDPVR